MKSKIAGLIILGALLSSCYKDNEEELYPNSIVNDTATYTYTADIKPLMTSNCAYGSCHVSGAQAPDLSNYNSLKANISSVKNRAIDLKTMPTGGPMSPANISKLSKWISDGALNN